VDFDVYLETCVTRFANPAIGDTIARLCQDGSNRQPKFVLPTIIDALAKDTDIDGLALEVALWCLYCAQPNLLLEDARADRLAAAALATKTDPAAFLRIRDVFGDIAENNRFASAFEHQVGLLWTQSPRQVLQGFLRKAAE
jgi:mannitol 2-dehydrogenase